MCIFPPLSNTVYEWVEWMWRMSERSGVDVENERVECMWTISEEDKGITSVCKKILEIHSYVFLFCFDDNVET